MVVSEDFLSVVSAAERSAAVFDMAAKVFCFGWDYLISDHSPYPVGCFFVDLDWCCQSDQTPFYSESICDRLSMLSRWKMQLDLPVLS